MVELSFDRFELDRDGTSGACKGDYVDIMDGQDSNSKSLGKFCGFTSPGPILSSGRYMRVRFRSDSGGPVYQGFKASFSAVKKSSKFNYFLHLFSGYMYWHDLTTSLCSLYLARVITYM